MGQDVVSKKNDSQKWPKQRSDFEPDSFAGMLGTSV